MWSRCSLLLVLLDPQVTAPLLRRRRWRRLLAGIAAITVAAVGVLHPPPGQRVADNVGEFPEVLVHFEISWFGVGKMSARKKEPGAAPGSVW
jgi:hypothetical protein